MDRSLENRRRTIREAVASLAPGGQRRYPPGLRIQITEYARTRLSAGGSRAEVCAELGVSDPTLVRVLGEGTATGPLRPVRVVASRPVVAEASMRLPLLVRTASGLQIEGLDVAGVAALVRALS